MDYFINIPAEGSEQWKAPVDTAADLPTTGNQIGDVRLAKDTLDIYGWNGTMWVLIAGPSGAMGIISLNGQTGSSQTFATSESGTNFTITSAGNVHTFNLPVASSTNTGKLSNTDWTTFNNKQASGSYITALTGDVTASGPGSSVATLATVNSNVGSFGSSTSIPNFTVNGKGLITAAGSNVVVAPAGTLTGTTLASNVISSSLTSVGTITSGVWNGTTIAVANGGTGQTSFTSNNILIGNGSSSLSTITNGSQYQPLVGNASGAASFQALNLAQSAAVTGVLPISNGGTNGTDAAVAGGVVYTDASQYHVLGAGTSGQVLQSNGAATPSWVTPSGSTVTIGAFDSQTPSANGLVITSSVLYAQSASITNPGMINNTTQTLSGNKTLNGQTTIGAVSSTSIHQINGGLNVTTRTITGNLTVDTTTTDYIIFVTTSSGAISITLPAPTNGRLLVVKDISGQANTNNITLVQHASENIEGLATSKILETNWGSWTITSDGTNWFMV